MPTPCYARPGSSTVRQAHARLFDSPEAPDQRKAAALCITSDCPVFDLCHELGRGEEYGIWAGTRPNDPERVAFRQSNDKRLNCHNGHSRDEYGVALEPLFPLGAPTLGCSRCAELNRELVERSC